MSYGLAKKMMLFALGRVHELSDRVLIESLATELLGPGTLHDLVLGIVQSEAFRTE